MNEVNLSNYDIDLVTPITAYKYQRHPRPAFVRKLTKPVEKLLLKTPKSLLELSVEQLSAKSAKNGENNCNTV